MGRAEGGHLPRKERPTVAIETIAPLDGDTMTMAVRAMQMVSRPRHNLGMRGLQLYCRSRVGQCATTVVRMGVQSKAGGPGRTLTTTAMRLLLWATTAPAALRKKAAQL
jgi:hypothetical protein